MNGYYNQVRTEMLPFVPHSAKMILEIGCADGNFGALLKARNGAAVWGLELEPKIAELAAHNLDKVITGSADVSLSVLPKQHFDCVICNDVLEHMAFPETVLAALRRVMSPGAVIVGSVPNVRYFPVLLDLVWNADWKYTDDGVLDRTHLRFFTGKSLERFLKQSGYEPLSIQGINPTPGIRARILRIVTLGRFSDCQFQQYAFVARPFPIAA